MKNTRQATRGFSLVEVVLALGVAAFCLVAIFGLLPIGVNSNQTSIEQTVAANIASMVMVDLQTIPRGYATASPRFVVPAPPAPGGGLTTHAFFLGEDGTIVLEGGVAKAVDKDAGGADNPRYRVTVSYNVPAANPANVNPNGGLYVPVLVPTRVLITWPALADPTVAKAPANFSGSFEVGGTLSRN